MEIVAIAIAIATTTRRHRIVARDEIIIVDVIVLPTAIKPMKRRFALRLVELRVDEENVSPGETQLLPWGCDHRVGPGGRFGRRRGKGPPFHVLSTDHGNEIRQRPKHVYGRKWQHHFIFKQLPHGIRIDGIRIDVENVIARIRRPL